MTIKQCDKCQANIDDEFPVIITQGYIYSKLESCSECAKPIVELLKKDKLLPKSWRKSLPKSEQVV